MINKDEFNYFHTAIAKKFNGKIEGLDGLDEPYVVIGKSKLCLVGHETFPQILCRWYNEVNEQYSSAFLDGNEPNKIWLAIESAKEILCDNDKPLPEFGFVDTG